jgi:hypothetical protein
VKIGDDEYDQDADGGEKDHMDDDPFLIRGQSNNFHSKLLMNGISKESIRLMMRIPAKMAMIRIIA